MQITNHSVSRQLNDGQTRVSAGDVASAFISDSVSANQNIQASAAKSAETQSPEARVVKAGIDPANHLALANAIKIFDGKGISLSKDDLLTIQKFMIETPGTNTEKLETVNILAQKGLPVTSNHLNAIHSALHGPDLKDALREVAGDIKFDSPDALSNKDVPKSSSQSSPVNLNDVLQQLKNGKFSINDVEALITRLDSKGNPEIEQIKQEIAKALQIHIAGTERIQQAANGQSISEGEKLQKIAAAKLGESLERLAAKFRKTVENQTQNDNLLKLHSLLKDGQKEPSLTKALESMGKALADYPVDINIDLTRLKASFEKASQLAEQGRELAARRVMADALNQLEKDYPSLQKSGEQLSLTDAEQYVINESLQSLALQSKSVLVTEISQKLSQLAIDFKKVKHEITKSLDHVSLMLDKDGSQVNAKQTLDAAINKLDNAILKSNFMLYTDMLTEKKMLNASSRLTEARNLLAKGDFNLAGQIVKEVKATLDQIIFKPSNTRVQHFVSEQSLLSSSSKVEDQLAHGIKQAVRPMPEQGHSARQVFESLKRLGLSHENDAANSLVFGSKGDQGDLNNNVKSRLIQMAQDAGGQPKAEQALANITGQQLLNKQESSGMQNLFLQMPFLLNQSMENIKVFINSQKPGEKIDWENCSLYFVLETKKLGEVGVQVTAQNRNISITFNSKKDGLDQMLEPMTDISKERLQEIGYKLEALKAKNMSVEGQIESSEEPIQSLTPAFTEKGYDFTI